MRSRPGEGKSDHGRPQEIPPARHQLEDNCAGANLEAGQSEGKRTAKERSGHAGSLQETYHSKGCSMWTIQT